MKWPDKFSFSLAPGFSPVAGDVMAGRAVLTAFRAMAKPLKRFGHRWSGFPPG